MEKSPKLIQRHHVAIYIPIVLIVALAYIFGFPFLWKLVLSVIGGIIGYLIFSYVQRTYKFDKSMKTLYRNEILLLIIAFGLSLPIFVLGLGMAIGSVVFGLCIVVVFLKYVK